MTEKNVDSENELLVASSHSQPIMSPLEERLVSTAYHKLVLHIMKIICDIKNYHFEINFPFFYLYHLQFGYFMPERCG